MLQTIELQNFRSYSKKTFQFDPSLTYIIGPNTAGKTNIIEAVFLIASGKSFRGARDIEMIQFGQQLGRVKVISRDLTMDILLTHGVVSGRKTPKKRYSVNGVPRRVGDTITNLPSVVFSPEDLDLVRGSPSLRRRFLDHVLTQSDREYRRHSGIYEKALRQRNKLLGLIHDGLASVSQLEYWNTVLIESGSIMHETRKRFLTTQNDVPIDEKRFRVRYDHSIISAERLFQYAQEEVSAKATLVGPHRDDFLLLIEKDEGDQKRFVELAAFGSRGEQRLGVLWLKLGALHYLTQQLHSNPLLLLDDIFSELDDSHQSLVLSLLSSHQTVITSADANVIHTLHLKYPGKIINL